jgi:Trk K+ transport system NAD-binding subunit
VVKSLGFILSYLATAQARRSVRILGWMLALLVVIVAVYSTVFHEIMEREGQSHSWPTAVYWTLVTMSTLGFGDITFESDLGRMFSVVVLLSGSAFILVLLPFTFIQFVFVPWMESSQRARAPRRLPRETSGHVLLTGLGAIEEALIRRLDLAGIPYTTIVADVDEALRLHDDGFRVMVGSLDDPDTFRAARVERAALVAATQGDTTNTNSAFTVREISESVRIVATANSSASLDILELAGCDCVLQLGEMLGTALARRVLAPGGRSQVIGEFSGLLIAEAAAPKALVGRPLVDSGLRQRTGLTVGGVWKRGQIEVARPSTVLTPESVLILAGSREQLGTYDELFGVDQELGGRIIIIGGGRVGRAAGRALEAAGLDYRIVEQQAERVRDPDRYVVGDAAEIEVLQQAGIDEARAVIITTHDDDVNVYLTIYCRRLRPDMQIIARAKLDRNVSTLHRAGADSVLSYASTGANAIWNVLSADNTLQLAEGLDVFRVPVPRALAGRTLIAARIRETTGCTVVAVARGDRLESNPDVNAPLPNGSDLVLIGDSDSEHRFLSRYRSQSPQRVP